MDRVDDLFDRLWRRGELLEAGQEHEAIVERLLASNYAVDEVSEPILFGQHTTRRIEGLVAPNDHEIARLIYSHERRREPVPPVEANYLAAFLDLPQPRDLRGFSIDEPRLEPQNMDRLCAKLHHCTALERLHLQHGYLSEANLEALAVLKELRILDLDETWLEGDCLALLRGMCKLEILRIHSDEQTIDQLAKLSMPKLKVLLLTGCHAAELPLTRAGFGRFPELEILVFENSTFAKIVCEPDGLPALKQLAILQKANAGRIPWSDVFRSVPQLQGVGLDATQIDSTLLETLLLPHFRRVYIGSEDGFPFLSMTPYGWAYHQTIVVPYPPNLEKEFGHLLAKRKDLGFFKTIGHFLREVLPSDFDYNSSSFRKRRWSAKN